MRRVSLSLQECQRGSFTAQECPRLFLYGKEAARGKKYVRKKRKLAGHCVAVRKLASPCKREHIQEFKRGVHFGRSGDGGILTQESDRVCMSAGVWFNGEPCSAESIITLQECQMDFGYAKRQHRNRIRTISNCLVLRRANSEFIMTVVEVGNLFNARSSKKKAREVDGG